MKPLYWVEYCKANRTTGVYLQTLGEKTNDDAHVLASVIQGAGAEVYVSNPLGRPGWDRESGLVLTQALKNATMKDRLLAVEAWCRFNLSEMINASGMDKT